MSNNKLSFKIDDIIVFLPEVDEETMKKRKGNENWNYSSAHGCGRILNRQSTKYFDLELNILRQKGYVPGGDIWMLVAKADLDSQPLSSATDSTTNSSKAIWYFC